MVLGHMDIHVQKRWKTLHKMNSKQVIDLSAKHRALKLPEDNIGENLGDLRYDDVF